MTTYGPWTPTPRWLQFLGKPPIRRSIYASWMIGGGWDGYEYGTVESALSAGGDEAKNSEGEPGKQSASGAAAAPIETEDAEVATRPSEPSPPADRREIVARLLTTAKLLFKNAIGCATNHYGHDCELNSLPGWLTDCERDIKAAESITYRANEIAISRDRLISIISAIDHVMGDTDPSIPIDYTDQEIKRDYPLFWICRELDGGR